MMKVIRELISISNWALDASKQNRNIFISRSDPNLEDLTETGRVISKA